MTSVRARSFLGALGGAPLIVLGFSLSWLVMAPSGHAAEEAKNSCRDCHSNPDFLVQNKKLYDYYQEWSDSVHSQEGMTCDDCHGGNPESDDKDKAHGDGVSASDPTSGVYYKNIPETCGACHEEILEGFTESEHFAHVVKKGDEEQGPTCVTCHGSIDSEILNVTSVEDACARCHNEATDNHPENPEKARDILNRFLSINHFYRYITIRAEPEEAKAFFEEINPQIRRLSVTWHTFDLEKIDQGTANVLALLKAKRDEIRLRRKSAKE